MKKLSTKTIVVFLFLIILVSGFLYRDSFHAYFFQDDWFNLKISNAKNMHDVLLFFIPRTDVTYYKPLGMQLPFYVMSSIFGFSPFPFHVLTYVTHSVNIILLFIFIRLLLKRDDAALLASFLYGTSSVHYTSFYWPSAYCDVISPTVLYISMLLFLQFINRKKNIYYLLSILACAAGLLTNELVLVLPVLLVLCLFMLRKFSYIKHTIPFFLMTIVLYLLRFSVARPPISGLYQIALGKHIFTNIEAYVLWSFNWPEEMKAQMVNFFTINPRFIYEFSFYYRVFIGTLIINLILFILAPVVFVILREKNAGDIKAKLFFGIGWFLTGLLPVIFFPYHSFSYLLPIPLFGLLFLSAYLFAAFYDVLKTKNKFIAVSAVCIVVINWLLISSATIEFNSNIHWAPRRAKIAKDIISNTDKYRSEKYPYIYNIPYSSENKLALNDQDALQLLLKNNSVITRYYKRSEDIDPP